MAPITVQTVVDVLGRERAVTRTYGDGSVDCPFCTYPIVVPMLTCGNPWCVAHPTMPVDAARKIVDDGHAEEPMSAFPSADDAALIALVVNRTLEILDAEKLLCDPGRVPALRLEMNMDLAFAHSHNPLRLAEMVDARAADLVHDVLGIRSNLNRTTGGFRECFLPRFSVRT